VVKGRTVQLFILFRVQHVVSDTLVRGSLAAAKLEKTNILGWRRCGMLGDNFFVQVQSLPTSMCLRRHTVLGKYKLTLSRIN